MKLTTVLASNLLPISILTQACSVTQNVKITFFGFPDNSPKKSDAIKYNCGRGFHAGGSLPIPILILFLTASPLPQTKANPAIFCHRDWHF